MANYSWLYICTRECW